MRGVESGCGGKWKVKVSEVRTMVGRYFFFFVGGWRFVCVSYEEGMLGVFVSAVSRRGGPECYVRVILVWWLGRRELWVFGFFVGKLG